MNSRSVQWIAAAIIAISTFVIWQRYRSWQTIQFEVIDQSRALNSFEMHTAKTRPIRFQSELQNGCVLRYLATDKHHGRILIFPVGVEEEVAGATVYNEGSLIGRYDRILEQLISDSGRSTIYSSTTPGKLFFNGDTIHVKPGLSGKYWFTLIASAEFAGADYPEVSVRVDHHEVGRVQICSADWRRYELAISLKPEQVVDVTYINDYYNSLQATDRNVNVIQVDVRPRTSSQLPSKAIWSMLKPKIKGHSAQYVAVYEPLHPAVHSPYLISGSLNRPMAVTGTALRADRMLEGWKLASGAAIAVPMKLTAASALSFDYAAQCETQSPSCITHLRVDAERFWGPVTLLSSNVQNSGWNQTTIDLNKFANEPIRLWFRVTGEGGSLLISEPRISVSNAR